MSFINNTYSIDSSRILRETNNIRIYPLCTMYSYYFIIDLYKSAERLNINMFLFIKENIVTP